MWKLRHENLFTSYEMFLAGSISKQTRPTPETICEALSLQRIVYGQALLEWYEEVSKLLPPPGLQPEIMTATLPDPGPMTIKTGFYLHSNEGLSKQVLPPYEQGRGDLRHEIIDRKVLNCLRDGPLDTLSIAKKILGRITYRLPISAILYRMASEGKIIHHQDGDLHTWELTSPESMVPIVVPIGASVAMA